MKRLQILFVILSMSLCVATLAANAAPSTPARPISGGANQVDGLAGKLGQVLMTGKWRFRVEEVSVVDSYKCTRVTSADSPDYSLVSGGVDYDYETKILTARSGQKLVTVQCLLKNALNKKNQALAIHGSHNAITNDQGESFPMNAMDVSGDVNYGKDMLPGSALSLVVVFSVPANTVLKDLVLSLGTIDNDSEVDVRVSLAR